MVCEDLWFPATPRALAEQGAEILIAPHASPFRETGLEERRAVAQARAHETGLASVISNQLGGQDQLIFDGGGFVVDGTGEVVVQTPLFERTVQTVTFERRAPGEGRGLTVRQPMMAEVDGGADRVYRALIMGLRDYVHKSGFSDVLLGLSGGIDSALVAVLAVDAFGPAHVKAFKLPSRYTSRESREDAETLAKSLGIELGELPIAEITDTAERVLDQEVAGQSGEGLAWENLQSRVRGALLMTVSNAQGALLLTTGNKSEVAVGYTTLYGDMCGAMNPLKDVYKTRVYAMALRRNHWKPTEALGPDGPLIPDSILTKAPTAELKPDQKDTDSLPAYEDLDPILECLVERAMSVDEIAGKGFDHALVARVENLLHGAEYKRRQAAPGLKVTNMAFGLDRRYPIVNAFRSGGGSA
jgi:NAD+ synthase